MALKTKHLFPFIRLINKLDIKNELKVFYFNKENVSDKSEAEQELITQEKGMDFAFMLLEKAPLAEREFYDFLSLYSEKPVEEILDSDPMDTIQIIKDIMQEKNFSTFFRQAVK